MKDFLGKKKRDKKAYRCQHSENDSGSSSDVELIAITLSRPMEHLRKQEGQIVPSRLLSMLNKKNSWSKAAEKWGQTLLKSFRSTSLVTYKIGRDINRHEETLFVQKIYLSDYRNNWRKRQIYDKWTCFIDSGPNLIKLLGTYLDP